MRIIIHVVMIYGISARLHSPICSRESLVRNLASWQPRSSALNESFSGKRPQYLLTITAAPNAIIIQILQMSSHNLGNVVLPIELAMVRMA